MRLFMAIEIGDAAQSRAARLLVELHARARALASEAKITWVPAERMHLTLRFIGEVDAATGERILQALREPVAIDPFTVRWRGAGAFPPRGAPRVLWVDVEAGRERLVEAERRLSERLAPLGLAPGSRPYSPHLTVARVRDPAGIKTATLFERLDADLGETHVDAITLFQSHLSPKGPTYVALQRTPLRAG